MPAWSRTVAALRDPPVGLAVGGALLCIVLVALLISGRARLGDAQAQLGNPVPRLRASPGADVRDTSVSLPGLDALPRELRLLDELSREHELDLSQQSAQLARDKNGRYRYTVHLPAIGSYLVIRTFVAEALREIPNLALANLNLERGSIQDTVVNADIQFVFFFSG